MTKPKKKKKTVKDDGKDRKKYTHIQRREEILRLILEAGHPKGVSQIQLASIYGVSQVMIHKDIQAISRDIKKNLPNDAEFITHVVFQSAIKKLSSGNNSDKFKAAKLVKDWNDWLFDMGRQPKAALKLDTVIHDDRIVAKDFSDAWKKEREVKKCKTKKKAKSLKKPEKQSKKP